MSFFYTKQQQYIAYNADGSFDAPEASQSLVSRLLQSATDSAIAVWAYAMQMYDSASKAISRIAVCFVSMLSFLTFLCNSVFICVLDF
jgi:hypothetical protein